jgi:hypothetical protein
VSQMDKLSGRFYVLSAGKRARQKVECVTKSLPKVEHQTSNSVCDLDVAESS